MVRTTASIGLLAALMLSPRTTLLPGLAAALTRLAAAWLTRLAAAWLTRVAATLLSRVAAALLSRVAAALLSRLAALLSRAACLLRFFGAGLTRTLIPLVAISVLRAV
jgi:hypothetical protein